ncbi:MAG: hypothetical protein IPO50_15960 [Sphingomonadales bacterium]|nr:hypothetical protein [Sphingomonadales bacterium]
MFENLFQVGPEHSLWITWSTVGHFAAWHSYLAQEDGKAPRWWSVSAAPQPAECATESAFVASSVT